MVKILTASDVQKHNTRKSVWMVIKNDVYDVTAFLGQHPGGEDPLLEAAGKDATTAFEDVGHSSDARSMLKKYKIGSLAPGEKCPRLQPQKWMSSCGSSKAPYCMDDEKPRKRFSLKKPFKKPKSKSPYRNFRPQKSRNPRVIPRVPSIVVPRERRPRGPPCVDEPRRGGVCRNPPPPSGKMKWLLLALAAAVIAGLVYHKFS